MPVSYQGCAMSIRKMAAIKHFKIVLVTVLLRAFSLVQANPACANYQMLSDESRSAKVKAARITCDTTLKGWYRFGGKAGDRMVSSPPKTHHCGTHAPGWLSQQHPTVKNVATSLKVCFVWSGSSCRWFKMIQVINCGQFYIYNLQRPPACSLRYCGTGVSAGKSKVTCDQSRMAIVLSRLTYNPAHYSSITLADKSCKATISAASITLASSPSKCGAKRTETNVHIIYTNEVVLTAKSSGNKGLISREHDERISFTCKYDKDSIVGGASFQLIKSVSASEAGIGSFTFHFEMFQNNLYTTRYTSYPAKVKAKSLMYFQTRSTTQDSGLVLLVDQCYSTPTRDRNHAQKFVFIQKGCASDKTVKFYSTTRDKQRFSIQAFRYLQNNNAVYIHCLVLLCQKTSKDPRCTAGCAGNNIKRARRAIEEDTSTYVSNDNSFSKYYLLEAGPIVHDHEKSAAGMQEDETRSYSAAIISLVCGVAVLACIVVVMVIRMRRRGQGENRMKEEVGIDNAPSGSDYVIEDEEKCKGEGSVM